MEVYLEQIAAALVFNGGMRTGVSTVNTVPTMITSIASGDFRRAVLIHNTSAATVGLTESASITGGILLNPGEKIVLPFGNQVVVYGNAPTNGVLVRTMDMF